MKSDSNEILQKISILFEINYGPLNFLFIRFAQNIK